MKDKQKERQKKRDRDRFSLYIIYIIYIFIVYSCIHVHIKGSGLLYTKENEEKSRKGREKDGGVFTDVFVRLGKERQVCADSCLLLIMCAPSVQFSPSRSL